MAEERLKEKLHSVIIKYFYSGILVALAVVALFWFINKNSQRYIVNDPTLKIERIKRFTNNGDTIDVYSTEYKDELHINYIKKTNQQ